MTAAELIEKLSKLDPETPILVNDPGCSGCCSEADGEGVLVRWTDYQGKTDVVLMHPGEVRRQKPEEAL